MKKLLLVEDEKVLAKNVAFFLKKEGYEIDVVYDGIEGWEFFQKNHYDLLLLDWMMPKKDGLDLCREVRQVSDVPIIMLTAKSEVMDKVIGLEVGADDYLVKPFHQRELLARIHALFRRNDKTHSRTTSDRYVRFERLELDKDEMVVRYKDESIPLTVNEFKLLDVMMKHPGKVFYREALFERVWGDSIGFNDRTVDVNVSRLRKKLNEVTGENYLHAVRGIGYRFGGHQ
ncbi:response regulator transcription factor [Alkalihalobacterium chitinilyticum]|uniref:Response regulator transcription factor n=1 Tax=Alkalihalobacterium chitinilyticum TaxID=2980103 RepID=A0ABT5VFT0_9BACI|nr:response regulator transcription factor [Alkalihalobacterium chitinilyticum]MDE5414311.1 response regulator transcription factor [Alkalihalobacterium chitinilyticum]